MMMILINKNLNDTDNNNINNNTLKTLEFRIK